MLPLTSTQMTIQRFENSLSFPRLHYIERHRTKMFITAQTFILNIVIMKLDLMKSGGHALLWVTAHRSPGEPSQFDRLEAALAARLH
jgi:hypothetical protein